MTSQTAARPAPTAPGSPPTPPLIISLSSPRPAAPAGRRTAESGDPFHARLTIRDRELAVEVQDTDHHVLVGKTLAAAAYAAGVDAAWEGPHIVLAVTPPICFGKVHVSISDEVRRRQALEAACNAALGVLRSAGYQTP